MNKDQTLALFAQGREAWNAWANEMLARRAALEKAGTWSTQELAIGVLAAQNEATSDWFDAAQVDFTGRSSNDKSDFTGFLFPHAAVFDNSIFEQGAGFENAIFSGDAEFTGATFSGSARFDNATFSGSARFDNATFSGSASFGGTTFSGIVLFENAVLNGGPWFSDATFAGGAEFTGARFSGDAWFDNARFSEDAEFKSATFAGDAWFTGATFSGSARFDNATFSGYARFDRASFSGSACFGQTIFEGSATFVHVCFDKAASFHAAHAARGFSLDGTRFCEVPDFIQGHFAEAPRLDDACIGLRLGRADSGRAARFRALKRLAVQGHDHGREQEYFAGELKSLRGHHDKLLPNLLNLFRKGAAVWPGGARYWFGLGYQISSDFGRSILRPLGWLALLAAAFAWAYFGQHFSQAANIGHGYGSSSGAWLWGWIMAPFAGVAPWLGAGAAPAPAPPLGCLAGTGDPWSAAIGLSIRKALPFAGVASTEKLNQIYACLYGTTSIDGRAAPLIPDVVDYLGILQLLLSLVLIFLFLLAVRNHFRIR